MYKFKTKEFKALRAKWYKKLAKEGFTDVEDLEGYLKQWDSSAFMSSKKNPHTFESTQKYYALAGQFLHSHKFKSEKHLQVWSLHSDGHSVRAISEILKAKKLTAVHPATVHNIIRSLVSIMLTEYEDSNE